MEKLNDKFAGTGSMVGFVEETNKLFSAINNMKIIVPNGYAGIEPTAYLEKGKIVFDFGEALIFTLNNVVWSFSGTSFTAPAKVTVSYSASVESGKLVIRVVVNEV